MGQPYIDQDSFRWRKDDGGEAAATWHNLVNVDWSAPVLDQIVRLRFLLQNTGDKDESDGYRLEYNLDAAGWNAVTTTSSVVRSVGSANTTWTLTDEDATTQQVGSGTFDEGYWDDTGVTTSFTFAQTQESELEFCFQFRSADIPGGSTVQLRVAYDGGGALDAYTNETSITWPSGEFQQNSFRIRSGDIYGLNVDNGWAAAESTDADIDVEKVFRIRFEVQETASISRSATMKLQYRKNAGSWTDLTVEADPWTSATNPAIFITNSAQYADSDTTTNVLTNSAKTFVAGSGEENNATGTVTLNNQHTELEWALFMRHFYDGPGQNDASDYFEFRIVESDGTVFDGVYDIPRVNCTVPAGLIGGCWAETPNRIGPFADANGKLYFLHEPSHVAGHAFCIMIASSDGGDSWAEVDGANRPTTKDLESVDISQDGSTLHIVHMDSTGAVVYHRFLTSDDGSNPDTWSITDESVASVTAADQTALCQHRSDGTIIAGYQETVSGDEKIRYKIRSYPGAVWGSAVDLDNTASESNTWANCVLGESDNVHFFYLDNTNGYCYHKYLNSSDVLSGRSLVHNDCGVGSSDEKKLAIQPVYWDDAGDEKVMIVVHDESDSYGWSSVVTNGTPGSVVQATDNTVDFSMGGGSLAIPAVTAIDGEDVYLLYGALADGDLWLAEYLSSAWGTDVEQQTATQIDWVVGQVFTHSPGNGGAKVLGYVWDDNSNGYTGKARYDELVISAVAFPPVPGRVHRDRRNVLLRM